MPCLAAHPRIGHKREYPPPPPPPGKKKPHKIHFHVFFQPHFTDTYLIQTPHYYGQFALSLGKEILYIFSTFNPFNADNGHLFLA